MENSRAKSRTNPVEARAVVAEIIERLSDPARKHQSIGVVTFNQAQKDLIEDLLDAARKDRRDLDDHFDTDKPNAVMVKNLENVQGDERDVMFLSICYGPDAAGKVGFHFGPLNRAGGERRLNVAITRAKYETVVFSSLRPEQIDLSRTRALGVKHLRNYLEYARSGPEALAALVDFENNDDFESPFEKQVAEFLRRSGFEVVSQVGCSGYRIDLGIISPDDPGHFILGVECDGKNYHSAKTARDRDRLRESILEGLGWRLYRIWSTDWFYNRDTAQSKLLEAVNNAVTTVRSIREAGSTQISNRLDSGESRESTLVDTNEDFPLMVTNTTPVENVHQRDDVIEESTVDYSEPRQFSGSIDTAIACHALMEEGAFDGIPVYAPAVFNGYLKKAAPFFSKESDHHIRQLLRKVVDIESPISVDAALLRVAGFWGHKVLTPDVRDRMMPALRGLLQKRHQGKPFFWKNDRQLDTYREFRKNGTERDSRRKAHEIPPEEFSNAIEWLVHHDGPLSRDELMRLLANALRLESAELADCPMLEIGIELLVEQGRVKVNSSGIFKLIDP